GLCRPERHRGGSHRICTTSFPELQVQCATAGGAIVADRGSSANPRRNTHTAARTAGAAVARKMLGVLHPNPMKRPPTTGPTTEPIRPIPSAQPTPVDLMGVG